MSTNYVPAIKAKMGDWTYYITKMKFGEVAKQVELAEAIHPNKELDKLIQRGLSNRVEAMTNFLLTEPQRFYGSLVVAIYKGNPRFHPIRIDEGHGIVDRVDHDFGLLQMDGSQTYFALDGQHRLESIKEACKKNPDLKDEDISVLIIKHDETTGGLVRTRRLFTKLNRYAKATDTRTNIAIDEDDCIAITTRRLIRELDLLKGIIKVNAAGKQIGTGKSDAKYFTTMAGLYEMNKLLWSAFRGGTDANEEYLRNRPNDEYLDDLHGFLKNIIVNLFKTIPILKRISIDKENPGIFRTSEGGNVWVRPIFQLIAAEYIQRALLAEIPLEEVINKLVAFPVNLTEEPWVRVIWNPGTKKITGTKAEREFCVEALVVSTGIGKSRFTKKEIREKYGKYYDEDSKHFPTF